MAQLFITLWRDIPSQVTAQQGRKRAKQMLSQRFQEAIDHAAMRTKLTGTDAYIEQWRRSVPQACGDDLEHAVGAAVTQLEHYFSDQRLVALIQQGGIADHETDLARVFAA